MPKTPAQLNSEIAAETQFRIRMELQDVEARLDGLLKTVMVSNQWPLMFPIGDLQPGTIGQLIGDYRAAGWTVDDLRGPATPRNPNPQDALAISPAP